MPRFYFDPKRRKSAERTAKRTAAAVDPDAGRCSLIGCIRPVQAAAGQGFSTSLCRYHVQHLNRHGSTWKKTYTKDHLKPYKAAARILLVERCREKDTERALIGLRDLMNHGGRHIVLAEVRLRSAEEKARAAVWRLQVGQVTPSHLLEIHLAITAAVRNDFAGGDEFRLVQIAKATARLAGGEHKVHDAAPTWSVYQRSAGLWLRVLGGMIEGACGDYSAAHVDAMLAMVREKQRASRIDMAAPLS